MKVTTKFFVVALILSLMLSVSAVIAAEDVSFDQSDLEANDDEVTLSTEDDSTVGVGEEEILKNEYTVEGNDFSSIQTTINQASEGSKIFLGAKNYTGDGKEITVDKSITIIGGSSEDDGKYATLDAKKLSRIVKVTGGNVVLKGIIFTNAKTTDNGGAMYGGSALNCIFNYNSAKQGGAMYRGTAWDCIFNDNVASYDYEGVGGAMYGGTAVNCTFNNNEAFFDGGAMIEGSAVNCTFNNNEAFIEGGAMTGGSAVNSTFNNNKAQYGGAMSGEAVAVNCIFNNNNAPNGGAIWASSADTCIFKTPNDSTDGNSRIKNPNLVADYADEKLWFKFTANNGMLIDDGNITVEISDGNNFVGNYTCLSGEGLSINLEPGLYVAKCYPTYFNINPVTVSISIFSFSNVQKLIDTATGEVIFLNGTKFIGTGQGINVNRTLKIVGGFSEDDGVYATLDARQLSRIMRITADNVVLKGIIFTNGKVNDGGGAIYVNSANFNAVTCTFNNNSAADEGGAMYGGSAFNCTFNNNRAAAFGGAMYESYAFNCTFNSNYAAKSGGAMNLGSAEDCIFMYNKAEYNGGGLCSASAVGCTFFNNSAHHGGAMIWGSGAVNCTFNNNYASFSGGAMSGGSAFNCTFNNNHADYAGGAMWAGSAEYCIFISNKANHGNSFFKESSDWSITKLHNNIYLNSNGDEFYSEDRQYLDIGYNWFGNTADNYLAKPNDYCTKWLFLNVTADPEDISILGTSNIIFKLSAYDGNVSEYDNTLLHAVNLTLTSVNGDLNRDVADLDEGVTFTPKTLGSGKVTAEIENIQYSIDLNIIKADSNLSVKTPSIYYGNNAILLNYDSSATGKVNMTLKGKKYSYSFEGLDLNASITLPETLLPDEYEICVKYSGDSTFFNSTATSTLTVIPVTLLSVDLSVDNNESAVGDVLVFTVKITNNGPCNATNINVVDILPAGLSIVEGDLSRVIPFLAAGNFTVIQIKVKSTANGTFTNHVEVFCSENVTVCSVDVNLTVKKDIPYLSSSGLTTTYKTYTDLIFSLKDSRGNPIAGVDTVISINGVDYVCPTDSKGDARLTIRLNPKTYAATMTFSGNDRYDKMTSNVIVTVKKATPKLTAKKKTFKKSLKVKKYRVVLKTDLNTPMSKVKVVLKIKGKKYTARTDAKGKATFKIKKLVKKGKYSATVSFNGNYFYEKVTKKVKISVR